MLTIEDCKGLCGLTDEELEVIAEHRRLSPIVAAELAAELLQSAKGTWLLRSYLLEALEIAVTRGQHERARRLDRIISRFISAHPVPVVL